MHKLVGYNVCFVTVDGLGSVSPLRWCVRTVFVVAVRIRKEFSLGPLDF